MTKKKQQLGKYRILEELGKGGFATVYRALDTTLEREVERFKTRISYLSLCLSK